MIVCVCKAVNDRAIRRAVAYGIETFEEIQFELGVGIKCGKCVSMACEVLCEARLEARRQHGQDVTAGVAAPVFFAALPSSREAALA